MLPAKAYLIPDKEGDGSPLHRLPAEAGVFSEDWLQNLLFRHASLLPLKDIGTDFSPGIPVGREIANTDLLLVSPAGAITIVETKLWRNPEAHRTVVAQILEYARSLGTFLATGRRYVHFDDVSEDEVVLLLSASDKLLESIAASHT